MIDNTDIAAAALKPNGVGRCGCMAKTKRGKPSPKCPKCRGTGKITVCKECEGSGWNGKTQKRCPNCDGQGFK